jgi:redox-sensitive bicupin YhaK (pirin superfamily)
MDRKDFIRKSLLGGSMFVASAAMGNALVNGIDELKPLEPTPLPDLTGFNHLPPADSKIADNTVYHPAHTRGHADHGWLNTHHTFSFANYYHPERMHFGVLRVLNDDIVAPGMGFGTHPHDNMEIISIPLEGDLEHKDSMGNVANIRHGDVQVMSAGTGIEHSEYNKNSTIPVKFLQIWVFPNKRNLQPRYDQISLHTADRHNKLQQILSPSPHDAGVWIHQDAWFHLGTFDKGMEAQYALKKAGNGIYAFVLKGSFQLNGHPLNLRDGFGIWDVAGIELTATAPDSEILLMDVPMTMNS